MMRFLLLFLGCFFALSFVKGAAVHASELTVDLAEDFVDITTGFNGAHLVVFGTRHRKGDLAIVIRGPEKDAVVRQKSKVFGVWMNTEALRFKDVPSYYDYGLSAQKDGVIDEENAALFQKYKIGINPDFFAHEGDVDGRVFHEALLRTKQDEGAYPRESRDIQFLDDNLFRVEFYLPASVPKGEYKITSYLMDNGRMLDRQEMSVDVKQVGLSSTVNKVAYEYSFGYGCLCVFLALFAGWAINALRRGF